MAYWSVVLVRTRTKNTSGLRLFCAPLERFLLALGPAVTEVSLHPPEEFKVLVESSSTTVFFNAFHLPTSSSDFFTEWWNGCIEHEPSPKIIVLIASFILLEVSYVREIWSTFECFYPCVHNALHSPSHTYISHARTHCHAAVWGKSECASYFNVPIRIICEQSGSDLSSNYSCKHRLSVSNHPLQPNAVTDRQTITRYKSLLSLFLESDVGNFLKLFDVRPFKKSNKHFSNNDLHQ